MDTLSTRPSPETVPAGQFPTGLFAAGKPVLLVSDLRLHAALEQSLDVASDQIVVAYASPSAAPSAGAAGTGEALPRAILFRPDGVAAWRSPSTGPATAGLTDALRAVGLDLPPPRP